MHQEEFCPRHGYSISDISLMASHADSLGDLSCPDLLL